MTDEGARDRIAKLLAIYKDRPSTPEGQNALKHAERLIAKYKITFPPAPAPGTSRTHTEVTRIASAFRSLIKTKPIPRSKRAPDIAELERLFMVLMQMRNRG